MRTKNFFMLLGAAFLLTNVSQAQIWLNSGTHAYLNTPTYTSIGIGTNAALANYPFRCIGQGRFCATTGISSPFVEFTFPASSPTSLELGSATTANQIDFKGTANITADYRGRLRYTDGVGFSFQTAGVASDRLIISDGGLVGIGITPAANMQLHVEGLATKFSSGTSYIGFSHGAANIDLAGTSPLIDFKGTGHLANDFWGRFSYVDGTGFDFYTAGNGTPKMRLKEDGKLLIGDPSVYSTSTTGTYKLYVADGILTEKVKVAVHTTTDWADYVFAPDYQLLSLDSVETYINNNQHLPGIPSSEEMVQNGSDLASTDKMLLEKVENLYLYIIQLNKEIEALKFQNEQLILQQDETK